MATKTRKADIPRYELGDFRHVHRVPGEGVDFGCNLLDRSGFVPGFELYSRSGLVESVGPLRSAFYRVSITVSGELDMQIGLEHYRHRPRTLAFTFPFAQFTAGLPVARAGRPEEVADAIVFLAGNGYITGKVLGVDGGMA